MGPCYLKSIPSLSEWIQLPWHVCWNLMGNSGSKKIYVWKLSSPAQCLKSFVIQLPFAWVSQCLQLEIGFLVESTWQVFCGNCDPFGQQVAPNLFAYIWKNFVVGTSHLYEIWKGNYTFHLKMYRLSWWMHLSKSQNCKFCCVQFQNIYITSAF